MNTTRIVPWERVYTPLQDLVSKMDKNMTTLFSDPFFEDSHKLMQQKRKFPKLNISETDKYYIVDVALPGLDKKDIRLLLEDDKLTISSKLVKKKEETSDNFLIREISSRSFCRTIAFPKKVKLINSKSSLKNGILSIEIQKEEVEEKQEEVNIEIE